MTEADVLRIAQEAGFGIAHPALARFAALVRAQALEDAAKVCDAEASIEGIAQRCAEAIRGMK